MPRWEDFAWKVTGTKLAVVWSLGLNQDLIHQQDFLILVCAEKVLFLVKINASAKDIAKNKRVTQVQQMDPDLECLNNSLNLLKIAT